MHETDEERERRLRQIVGGGESWESWYRVSNLIMDFDYASLYPEINPCAEITIASSQQRTLGDNPLIKFTKYKFNFNGKR